MGLIRNIRNAFGNGQTQIRSDPRDPEPSKNSQYWVDDITKMVFNKLSFDVSRVIFEHVSYNNDGNQRVYDTDMNRIFSHKANEDQSWQELLEELTFTMLSTDKAVLVATEYEDFGTHIVPKHIRVGRLLEMGRTTYRVNAYDYRDGRVKEIQVNKNIAVRIPNPIKYITNSNYYVELLKLSVREYQNYVATLKIQAFLELPYTTRQADKRILAQERKKEIRDDLANDDLPLAFLDAGEKLQQLGRDITFSGTGVLAEAQKQLVSWYGIPQAVLDGTATNEVRNAYYQCTVLPIAQWIANELIKAWIDPAKLMNDTNREKYKKQIENINEETDALTQLYEEYSNQGGQQGENQFGSFQTGEPLDIDLSGVERQLEQLERKLDKITNSIVAEGIRCYISPFGYLPVDQIGQVGDSLTRNAILTPNEVRELLGFAPAEVEQADELYNRNIGVSENQVNSATGEPNQQPVQNGANSNNQAKEKPNE